MNAKELTFKGHEKTVLYACGLCGSLHSPKVYASREDIADAAARDSAEKCCAPKHCACGAEIEGSWTACEVCRLRRKLTAATITTEYTGEVYSDEVGGEWGEGYSPSISAMLDYCCDYDEREPAYCWPCEARPLRLEIDQIIKGALDDMHEDAGDHIVGYDDLRAAIDAFNEAQTCVTYYPDYTRIIILDRDRFDALIAAPEGGAARF